MLHNDINRLLRTAHAIRRRGLIGPSKYCVELKASKPYKIPAAIALADRLGLNIPNDTVHGSEAGLIYPMRRHVVTGEDSPANMKLLFAPKWKADTAQVHWECRHMVLATPADGSSMQAMARFLEERCKRWNLRPATQEERGFVWQAEEMQRLFFG
ncbi:hypothetical protein Q9189_006051 [Teloschistes chrysophthalmus]